MLFPSGNPFKCHEEVLYLQPLIPPKRFDISPSPTGGYSEGLGAFRFLLKKHTQETPPASFFRFCFFLFLFLRICLFFQVFLYHHRFLLVWTVRRTLLPSGWCFSTFFVTTGWIFTSAFYYVRIQSINQLIARFSQSMEMSRLTRDGNAEPVSRDQILRHEQRGQGSIHFSCSADHAQDWQPHLVDPYSCYIICVPGSSVSGGYAPDWAKAEGSSIVDEPGEG